MQPWAESFYKGRAWRQCQEAYKRAHFGLCEWCGAPGVIVHHHPTLTPQTINDPEYTLGWDHLTLLCRDCHGLAHSGRMATTEGTHFDAEGNLVRD